MIKKNKRKNEINNKIEVWMRVNKQGILDQNRIRIIEPDGRVYWGDGSIRLLTETLENSYWSSLYPCWHKNERTLYDRSYEKNHKSMMTKKEAIKAMKKYDKSYWYKSVKIGEL